MQKTKVTLYVTLKKISKDDIVAQLSSFWNILTEDEQNFLYDQLSFHAYKKNDLIYAEEQQPTDLLCLITGQVKIYRIGSSDRSQIMRLILPVDFFGYRAYFAGENYVTNACAFEPSLVCNIPMQCIEKIVMQNNRLAMFFIRQLSVDLGISDRRSITLTQSHIRGRLAETLLFLKETYGVEADNRTLRLNLSREDLAALSNMTTANAIRTLSNFAAEGLVKISGRNIRLLDEDHLKHIARIG